jgi:hypothetical protein
MKMTKEQNKEKLRIEIITSLSAINEIACFYLNDEQNDLRNQICRELRKIHSRVEKLSKNK